MTERFAEHKWRHRLLIVFAPDEADARLVEQRKLLEEDETGFGERDLVPIYSLEENDEAREDFGVAEGSFAAILVGKDGTEKARFMEPIEPGELFRRIDGMPMRRREMERGS
jgi:hypothetical protein